MLTFYDIDNKASVQSEQASQLRCYDAAQCGEGCQEADIWLLFYAIRGTRMAVTYRRTVMTAGRRTSEGGIAKLELQADLSTNLY
jgi:hypothetical protein